MVSSCSSIWNVTTNPTLTSLGLSFGFHGERPVTTCQSCGMTSIVMSYSVSSERNVTEI